MREKDFSGVSDLFFEICLHCHSNSRRAADIDCAACTVQCFPEIIKKYPFRKRALLCNGDNNPFPSYLLLLMPHFFPPIFWQGNIISSTQENRHFDAFGWWGGNREQGCHQKLLDSPPKPFLRAQDWQCGQLCIAKGGKTLVPATNIYPCSCCCCRSSLSSSPSSSIPFISLFLYPPPLPP